MTSGHKELPHHCMTVSRRVSCRLLPHVRQRAMIAAIQNIRAEEAIAIRIFSRVNRIARFLRCEWQHPIVPAEKWALARACLGHKLGHHVPAQGHIARNRFPFAHVLGRARLASAHTVFGG